MADLAQSGGHMRLSPRMAVTVRQGDGTDDRQLIPVAQHKIEAGAGNLTLRLLPAIHRHTFPGHHDKGQLDNDMTIQGWVPQQATSAGIRSIR